MKYHTKRRWMENIKHLDSYLVIFSIINTAATFVFSHGAIKSWKCCNLENM